MLVWLFIAGSVLCAWAMLRIMGNERTRGQREMAARVRAEWAKQEAQPDSAGGGMASPIRKAA